MKKLIVMLLLSALSFTTFASGPIWPDILKCQQDTTQRKQMHKKDMQGKKKSKDGHKWNKDSSKMDTSKSAPMSNDTTRRGM